MKTTVRILVLLVVISVAQIVGASPVPVPFDHVTPEKGGACNIGMVLVCFQDTVPEDSVIDPSIINDFVPNLAAHLDIATHGAYSHNISIIGHVDTLHENEMWLASHNAADYSDSVSVSEFAQYSDYWVPVYLPCPSRYVPAGYTGELQAEIIVDIQHE